MNAAGRVGLLGGTLDPIHEGHIEAAKAARTALALDRVIVLPSRIPPHRLLEPVASRYHRFAMAALAVNGIAGLSASDLELCSPGLSYTADTLVRFREHAALYASQIFFITGADAFAEIATWHRYPEVLDLANFVVISRPGFPADRLLRRLPSLAGRMRVVADSGVQAPGSGCDESCGIFLVDAATPDISSTEVRRRLSAGENLTGLVPLPVERHIFQHGLYSRTSAHRTANHLHGEN